MSKFAHCNNVNAVVSLLGRSTMRVKRELRAKLAASLASGARDRAFAKECAWTNAPRVDELEALMASFPNQKNVDWDAKPVKSGIRIGEWKRGHAAHCSLCSMQAVNSDCYFKLLLHFLECGFDPPVMSSNSNAVNGANVGRARRVTWINGEQKKCDANGRLRNGWLMRRG